MINYKHIIKKIFNCFTNNILINNVMILFRLDGYFKNIRYWRSAQISRDRPLSAQVGYSDYPEVRETLEKIHSELKASKELFFPGKAKILDVGCGPGLFLSDFSPENELTGIDLSLQFIKIASERLSCAEFLNGDVMTAEFNKKFDLIYAINILQYINRSGIDKFFKRIFDLLEPAGILFMVYPHALSLWDTMYPDRTYIQYSPLLIRDIARKYFKIIKHQHVFDGRIVGRHDIKTYKNEKLDRLCKNNYLFIARRNI